jgi:hypothetical protein
LLVIVAQFHQQHIADAAPVFPILLTDFRNQGNLDQVNVLPGIGVLAVDYYDISFTRPIALSALGTPRRACVRFPRV